MANVKTIFRGVDQALQFRSDPHKAEDLLGPDPAVLRTHPLGLGESKVLYQ